MWNCPKCGEEVEEILEVCWNCQTSRSGRSSEFQTVPGPLTEDPDISRVNRKFKPMKCARCPAILRYVGEKSFHVGPQLGALGDFAELLVGRESLEMYHCEECGHVEFFLFG